MLHTLIILFGVWGFMESLSMGRREAQKRHDEAMAWRLRMEQTQWVTMP